MSYGAWATVPAWMLVVAACGGPQWAGGGGRGDGVGLEPMVFLAEVGTDAAPHIFSLPTRTVDEIEAERRAARGAERRALARDLAVALMHNSESLEGREARRARQRAERALDAAARGNPDDQLAAELAFVRLWMAWRAGSTRRAGRLSQRFTARYRAAGILTTMAYMVRGEVALANERKDAAIEAYRFALGQLGTPLYAFALYRTAHAQGALDGDEEGLATLRETEQLGCDSSAEALVVRVAAAAATELSTGLRDDGDGLPRPASCPEPDPEEEEEQGWRPPE